MPAPSLGAVGETQQPGKGPSDREHHQGDLSKDLVAPNVTKIKSNLSCDCQSLSIISHSADIKPNKKQLYLSKIHLNPGTISFIIKEKKNFKRILLGQIPKDIYDFLTL